MEAAAAAAVLERGWPEGSAEGRELLGALLQEEGPRGRRPGQDGAPLRLLFRRRLRAFGLLERPALPPRRAADVAAYKLFVSGRSGVGKTALVARAAGRELPRKHQETPGIQTTTVFWPAKLRGSGRALFFRFSFWDCGEAALRKFDHLLPSCTEKADAILLLFSFTDRASFEDLPLQISRMAAAEGPNASASASAPALLLAVGTKFDQFAHADVTEQDLAAFRRAWGLPVLRVKSLGAPRLAEDGRAAGLLEMAPFLDELAERLWRRDQLAAGLLPPPRGAP